MSLTERVAGTMKGLYQSVFERGRVHRIPTKTIGESSPSETLAHSRLLRAIEEGTTPQYSVLEFTTHDRPADKKGKGTLAILVGIGPRDPYLGVNLFLLDKQPEGSPRLVTERWITSYTIVGPPTDEQVGLVEKELKKIKSRTRAFESGAFRGNPLT